MDNFACVICGVGYQLEQRAGVISQGRNPETMVCSVSICDCGAHGDGT